MFPQEYKIIFPTIITVQQSPTMKRQRREFTSCNQSTLAIKKACKIEPDEEQASDALECLETSNVQFNNETNFQIQICQQLHEILLELKEIKKNQEEMKKNQEEMKKNQEEMKIELRALFESSPSIYKTVHRNDMFNIPLENDEQLNALLEVLPEHENYLATLLSSVGGNNLRKNITCMLKKLFKKDLARKFSSKGKKGKRDFSATKLYPVIIKAARIRFETSSEEEITKLIGYGLATCGDWDGGAKARSCSKTVTKYDT